MAATVEEMRVEMELMMGLMEGEDWWRLGRVGVYGGEGPVKACMLFSYRVNDVGYRGKKFGRQFLIKTDHYHPLVSWVDLKQNQNLNTAKVIISPILVTLKNAPIDFWEFYEKYENKTNISLIGELEPSTAYRLENALERGLLRQILLHGNDEPLCKIGQYLVYAPSGLLTFPQGYLIHCFALLSGEFCEIQGNPPYFVIKAYSAAFFPTIYSKSYSELFPRAITASSSQKIETACPIVPF